MKRRLITGLALLAFFLGVIGAGFIAPYDPAEQNRATPFAPPTRLHLVDAEGQFHFRPFVYALEPDPMTDDGYLENRSRRFPIRFMVRGAAYSVLPGLQSNLHLIGIEGPARVSLLGTDGFGRDVFSRLLHGGRVSIGAGLVATFFALVGGLAFGTVAGLFGGTVDAIVMRVADLFMAVPWLYLLFAVRAVLPLHVDTNITFLLLVAALGAIGWARPARLIRGVVLSARERTYVVVARGLGAKPSYLLRRHLLPHTLGVTLTQAGLLLPQYILAEVTLSFLGLGVAEPTPSWGSMLGTLQQYHVLTSYWWMFAPAAALVVVAAACHAVTAMAHDRLELAAG